MQWYFQFSAPQRRNRVSLPRIPVEIIDTFASLVEVLETNVLMIAVAVQLIGYKYDSNLVKAELM